MSDPITEALKDRARMNAGPMQLYTSTGTRKLIEQCNAHNIGLLMVDHWRNPDDWPFFAIDNGCYASWHRHEEWNPAPFLNILAKCKALGHKPQFVVIPDRVADPSSLTFSKAWVPVLKSLYPEYPLYLAVQDGTTVQDVAWEFGKWMGDLAGIFIGGTMAWKMDHLNYWIDYAHSVGKKCHVGRTGPIQRMLICEWAGADSIDPTTWVQNKGGIDKYVGGYKAQTTLNEHTEAEE